MEYDVLIVSLAAFFAGFIDAIVGGGGLIQVPIMFLVFPQMPVSVVIGTNRSASFVGTLMAGYQYAKSTPIMWKVVFFAGITAAICAYLGALLASFISATLLKPIILVLIISLGIYSFFNKNLGQHNRTPVLDNNLLLKSLFLGALMGFYNGLIGPGTGTLLVFGFIAWLKFSFLGGSGISKFVNVVADCASLIFFLINGFVLFHLALPMLLCNLLGAYLGSRLAILKGNSFIRIMFLVVVMCLSIRLGYDLFFKS